MSTSPEDLLAEIRRSSMPPWAQRELERLVLQAVHNRQARRRGVAEARRRRTEAIHAAIERHVWKTPLTSPDFVEQVLQHFARSGEGAPSERAIRRWRDAQISIVQHKARGRA